MSSEVARAEIEVAKQRYAAPVQSVMRWSAATVLGLAAAIVGVCLVPGLSDQARAVIAVAVAGAGTLSLRPLLTAVANKMLGS